MTGRQVMAPRGSRWTLAVLWFAGIASAAGQGRPVSTRPILAADSAFNLGDIERAESLYYVGVRERPRDPIAREALGRYLAARGATKVAVVLLEEARLFGGEPPRIAMLLSPLYQYLGDWRALLTLPSSPLSPAERRRAAWLGEHAFTSRSDSTSVSLIGTPVGDTIGRIAIRIGGRTAVASVLSTDVGIVVGARAAGSAPRYFGDSTIVVIDSMIVGSMKFVNVPAAIGPVSGVTLGVASLSRMVPTFDYSRQRFTLMRIASGVSESRSILVRDGGQWRVHQRGRWMPLAEFAAQVARDRKTMTVDLRAGEVRVGK
jgi:hypothetical protein